MAKIITFANQKGGVGKTTTAHIVSIGIAKKGYKVLACDLDPQANLTSMKFCSSCAVSRLIPPLSCIGVTMTPVRKPFSVMS